MDEDTVGALFVFCSAAGFATLGIFGKLAAAAGLSIPTVLFFRFLLASLLFWGVLAARGEATILRGRALAVGVLLGGGGYAAMSSLYFLGLEYMTAGLVGILLYTYPAFVILIAVLALDEPVTGRTVAALALSLAGVALITGADPAAASGVGVAIMLAAALVYAGYITASRQVLGSVDAPTLTAHVLPAAAVTFLLIGTGTGSLQVPVGVESWSSIAGIAVVATAVPIFTFFAGIARVGASRASILSTVEPAITVALGALVLQEQVTVWTVVGGALVLGGVLLVQQRR
ncbi:DMT family transporter [Natronomonas sp. EA1]|uniref:DMT family transporter n=1 Tax=Natronomonas sp. EA1 TaxID=3421655 RepID=UPI003EB9F0D4